MSKYYDLSEQDNTTTLNRGKFTELERSDYDYRIFERTFTGKMTKYRYKKLDRFCRRNSWRSHCHHEYDCCGCQCAQNMSLTYSKNQISIILSMSFNY